jgi:hypothetical protein
MSFVDPTIPREASQLPNGGSNREQHSGAHDSTRDRKDREDVRSFVLVALHLGCSSVDAIVQFVQYNKNPRENE